MTTNLDQVASKQAKQKERRKKKKGINKEKNIQKTHKVLEEFLIKFCGNH